jgi:hypothetical protein
MPRFVLQRSLYEVSDGGLVIIGCKANQAEQVRERPSKVYSWIAFILANIIVEIPYQIMLGVLVYSCYYYAIFGYDVLGPNLKSFLCLHILASNLRSAKPSSCSSVFKFLPSPVHSRIWSLSRCQILRPLGPLQLSYSP